MTNARIMRRIVLPQAMRFIVPPTGNQVISMVKATALVSVIALSDLLYTVQSIYNRTFETIPMLIVACVWYLAITSVLYVVQSFIERHYSRGDAVSTGLPDFLRIRPTTMPIAKGRSMNAPATSPPRATLVLRPAASARASAHTEVLKGIDLDVEPARPSSSSARPARASPRSCAASTCSSPWTAAGSTSTARCRVRGPQRPAARAVAERDRPARRDIGMVFQQFNLFPHMTALENIIEAPIGVLGENRGTRPRRPGELLARRSAWPTGRRLSAPALRWPAAARRDRPGAGHASPS